MSRVLTWLTGLLGAGLLAAGVAVFAAADRARPPVVADTAPLQPEDAAGGAGAAGGVLWSGQHLTGVGLAVLGVLLLVGLVGWTLGRRSGRRSRRTG